MGKHNVYHNKLEDAEKVTAKTFREFSSKAYKCTLHKIIIVLYHVFDIILHVIKMSVFCSHQRSTVYKITNIALGGSIEMLGFV